MGTEDFYASLPLLTDFRQITDIGNFVSVPPDWYVLISDITGSTAAIARGKYKEVNMVGACSIASVLNVAKEIEIPFIFGGDGATLLIPPSLADRSQQALLASQKMSEKAFDLPLRIGMVPVRDIPSKWELKIAKLRISSKYSQAIIRGGGINYATELLKAADTSAKYQIRGDRAILAEDFSGLECRWQDVPSPHGETVSLIILATKASETASDQVYLQAIDRIQAIYGGDRAMHPVSSRGLQLSLQQKHLQAETKVFHYQQSAWQRWIYLWQIRLQSLLGRFLILIKFRSKKIDWGKFKQAIAASTDCKKFDDTLRMVIAGNRMQSAELRHYLEQEFRERNLVYGIHISNRALMTCLIFERQGRHVHFIDGADGGYAIAAQNLKRRLQEI